MGLVNRQTDRDSGRAYSYPLTMIGERIRIRREALGLSQNELARRAKVSQPVIFALESGEQQTTRKIAQIAAALGLRPHGGERGARKNYRSPY